MRLYTIYLPKSKGSTTNTVVEWIKLYSKLTNSSNSIIVSPGYMSNTITSIDDFLESIGQAMGLDTVENIAEYGILNGMNGASTVRGTKIKVLEEHKISIGTHTPQNTYFQNIDFDVKSDTDHRKVMVFFKRKKQFKDTHIDSTNCEKFADSLTVKAVLLGSSNQSKTTYFSPAAPKGEADIFMVIGKDMKSGRGYADFLAAIAENNSLPFNQLAIDNSSLLEGITISEAFAGKNYDKPDEFLRDILKDLLKTGLN